MKADFKRIAAWGGVLSAAAFYLYQNFKIEVEEHTVYSKKITSDFDGYKIVQLSDLHCRNFGYKNRTLIQKVKELSPDIIVMTGDMVSRQDSSFAPFYNLARETAKICPTYYIIGNHELDLSERQLSDMLSELRSMGVRVVSNEHYVIFGGKSAIDLYGMSCGLNFYKDEKGNYRHPDPFTVSDMRSLIGSAPASGRFSVLLAHNPLFFPVYSEWGPDLVLSGHVHGGGVRLGRLGGIFSPGRRFFPKYYQGEYSSSKTKMVVSRGLGGLRLFNFPQIVCIKLKTAAAKK